MNWVVIENTFVIIAASIPLLRPLFNIAKQQAMTAYGGNTAYEMNSRSRSNGTKGFSSSHVQNKSIQLHSSSEENILQVQGSLRSMTNVATKNNRESRDVEKGIKKETTVQIRYDEDDGQTPPGSKWGFGK
jgi:hypothetical protein